MNMYYQFNMLGDNLQSLIYYKSLTKYLFKLFEMHFKLFICKNAIWAAYNKLLGATSVLIAWA